MKTINCTITGQDLHVTVPDFRLVAGTKGLYQLAIEYDSGWDVAPTRVVVIKGSGAVVPVEDEGEAIEIPSAVLAEPGWVSIGVIGYSADGEIRITTKEMAGYRLIRVYPAGATPEDVEATAPEEEPEFWEQLLAKVGDLDNLNTEDKSSLVAAINEVLESGGGGGSGEAGGYYTPAVTQTDESTMRVSFTPSKDGMDEVPDVDVSLPKGNTGKTAYQYAQEGGYTGTEAEFAAKLAEEMPEALPNPNSLTFTGAVNGRYDESEALTVEIPSSGSGGTSEPVVGNLLCKLVGDGVSSEISQTFDESTMPDGLYYARATYGLSTDNENKSIYCKAGGAGIWGKGVRILYMASNTSSIVNYSSAFFAIGNGIVFSEHCNITGGLVSHIATDYSTIDSRTVSIYSQASTILTADTTLSIYRVM